MDSSIQAFRSAIKDTLGYAPETVEPGRFQRFATSDRRGDNAGWCKLFEDMRGGVFGCFRQAISGTWGVQNRATMTREQRAELARQALVSTAEREHVHRRQWRENAQRNARIWAACVELVPGDPVALYLKWRGFAGVWPFPACLRLHRALPLWDGDQKIGTYPAMVAPVVSPDGRVIALHRTYLHADGRPCLTREGRKVKKVTMTAGPLAGACISLHDPVGGAIGVAEGIETALAAWLASGVPTVAAYSAGNLAAHQWPAAVRKIVIFGDADHAGREAADALKGRALAAGLRCEVLTPNDNGADWCDVWAARGAVTVRGTAA